MDFLPFNPGGRVEISRTLLPHWQQGGRTYFITWRTADSIPAALVRQWKADEDAWLHGHQTCAAQVHELPADQRREYHERFSKPWQEYLDQGHGECLLKHAAVREVVAGALQHFDGDRYHLGDFVLMPNHVHVLVTPAEGQDMKKLCFSWKRFSSGEINRRLGRQGEFWQPESFDHIVRHQASLQKLQRYIAENPRKAGLGEAEHTLYQPAAWREIG